MFAFFLIVMGVPVVLAALAFTFLDGISWKEFAMIVAVELVVAGSSAGIVSCANTSDTEVWSGRVVHKKSEHVSCSHSYDCNCHEVCSGSGSNRSCSNHCDTCYEHSYDVDWEVFTSNGEEVDIDRVDRQGIHEPPRFSRVKVGEPTALTHSFKNYIKAAPGTLFRHQGLKEKYAASIPKYPQDLYDYYHVDRVVTVGSVQVIDGNDLIPELANLNADLGRAKQANIIIVLVRNMPQDYYYALEEAWIGGKKNDVILVVSVGDDMKPQWATVMCLTTNELFKVKLRDDVMNDEVVSKNALIADLKANVSQYYVRKPMADFEYLSAEITPSPTEWTVTLIIALILGIALIFVCQTQDIFGDEGYGRRRRY